LQMAHEDLRRESQRGRCANTLEWAYWPQMEASAGQIITEARNHPNGAAPVYIAAFALDEGESCALIEQALPSLL
jgi:hypothetical protein